MIAEPGPDGAIVIEELKHILFIEVDEKGTEAAAATSVETKADSEPSDLNVCAPLVT